MNTTKQPEQMATKKISQREAIRNRREMKALRAFVNDVTSAYAGNYLMNYDMEEFPYKNDALGTMRTANRMGTTIVAKMELEHNKVIPKLRHITPP